MKDPGIDRNAEVAVIQNRTAYINTELKRRAAVARGDQLAAELMRRDPTLDPSLLGLTPRPARPQGILPMGFRK